MRKTEEKGVTIIQMGGDKSEKRVDGVDLSQVEVGGPGVVVDVGLE